MNDLPKLVGAGMAVLILHSCQPDLVSQDTLVQPVESTPSPITERAEMIIDSSRTIELPYKEEGYNVLIAVSGFRVDPYGRGSISMQIQNIYDSKSINIVAPRLVINGSPVDFGYYRLAGTVLEPQLPKTLEPGDSIYFSIDFSVDPNSVGSIQTVETGLEFNEDGNIEILQADIAPAL